MLIELVISYLYSSLHLKLFHVLISQALFGVGKTNDPKDEKQTRCRKKLAFFLGTTATPISMTGNLEFLSYIHEVNPKQVVPGRNQAADDVKILAMDAK